MARRTYLPETDAGLLAWSSRFSALISATPEAFGLSAAQAAAYAALHAAYADAMAGVNPGERNKVSVATKNAARDALKAAARPLVMIVQGTAAVTDAQKVELGLTVRAAPSAIPPPADPPQLDVVRVSGRTISVRLSNAAAAGRRAKPPGVRGATLLTHVGPTPPTGLAGWTFERNLTRPTADVVFPVDVPPGSRVWLTAFWFNPRSQAGPACPPVGAYIQFGGEMVTAA